MWKVWLILIIAIVLFVAAVGGSFYGAWYFALRNHSTIGKDEWTSFTTIAGLGTAAAAALLTALVSVLNLFGQTKTTREVQRVTKVIERRIPAYGILYAAARGYYRHLVPLETGNFSVEFIQQAEMKMEEAEADIFFVKDDYANAWSAFWQHARRAKEEVSRHIHEPEQRKAFWREQCKILANDLAEMKSIAKKLLD
jgi:hypothetical protein